MKDLGLTKENAEIRVIEEGKKKLFGSVKARVEIAPLGDDETEKSAAETEAETVAEETQAEEKADAANEKKKRLAKIQKNAEGKTDGERAVEF